tara:strand:- start:125 stop:301 length:177 start_codon:yes stop_codon:yes gene_type:complete
MSDKDKKGFNWDGRTRVVTDLYRKNFDKIFKKKVLNGEDPFDKNKDEEEYLKELKKKL